MTSAKDPNQEKLEKLQRIFSHFRVIVAQNVDDERLTAFSNTEPLFCFVRNDIKAVQEGIESVLRSYLKTFYDLPEEAVVFEEHDVPARALPHIQRSRPIKTLSLRALDRSGPGAPAYAVG